MKSTYKSIVSSKLICVFLAAFANGCNLLPAKEDPNLYAVTTPKPIKPVTVVTGSIYHESTAYRLFEDSKARRVGDILTIVLNEKTNAIKKAKTDTTKDNTIDTSTVTPTLLGRPVTKGGASILGANLGSSQEFEGEGNSEQSNALTGTVAVTVADVLPNGNLVVKGQKRMVLNQGEEFIQISGIVRPEDITANNSVSSTLVADARITYSGKGAVADSNAMGWLSRFFLSTYWPF